MCRCFLQLLLSIRWCIGAQKIRLKKKFFALMNNVGSSGAFVLRVTKRKRMPNEIIGCVFVGRNGDVMFSYQNSLVLNHIHCCQSHFRCTFHRPRVNARNPRYKKISFVHSFEKIFQHLKRTKKKKPWATIRKGINDNALRIYYGYDVFSTCLQYFFA